MKRTTSLPARIFAGIIAVIGWFAVVMQFYLMLLNRTTTASEATIRFFSYFTILSNISVAFVSTSFFVSLDTGVCRFCARTSTLTAVTVYILVVGTVYNIVLRFIWSPEGLQLIVDELLHTFIPSAMLLFWLLFVPKNELQWKNSFIWLIFPLIYSCYIVVRGSVSGFYPYPFINVKDIGYSKAIANGGILLVVFWCFGVFLIGVTKWLVRLKK